MYIFSKFLKFSFDKNKSFNNFKKRYDGQRSTVHPTCVAVATFAGTSLSTLPYALHLRRLCVGGLRSQQSSAYKLRLSISFTAKAHTYLSIYTQTQHTHLVKRSQLSTAVMISQLHYNSNHNNYNSEDDEGRHLLEISIAFVCVHL